MKRIKFLVLSLLSFFGFLCFGFCDNLSLLSRSNFSLSSASEPFEFTPGLCIVASSYTSSLSFYNTAGDFIGNGNNSSQILNCVDFTGYITSSQSTARTYYYYYVWDLKTCPTCQVCQECEECVECPVIDSLYCLNNGLCPSNECTGGNNTGGIEWMSSLYINGISHQSAPFINISIPDYIYWDYTVNTGQFDLYVGSGYDQDYIDGVLEINKYKPDSGDFTNIFVSGLTLIFPYIFVVLLIMFIWRLLKRIFK